MTNQFLNKVSFVNKISLIMKATSDDETPIAGYLLSEVSNLTSESIETCESCLDFLVDRLQSDSTHVKLKVLKLMKYVVENGHDNFRLGLLKKSHGIKEATKFNGPPHPLHGNTPYIMVRKTAKTLSEILFNPEASVQSSTVTAEQKKHIQSMGIGSSQWVQPGSQSRMEGFGNTGVQSQTKSVGDSIKDGLLKMAEKLGDTTSDHQRELLSTIECSNYTPPTDSTGRYTQQTYTTAKTQHLPIKQITPPKHVPGRAGGGWEDSEDEDEIVCQSRSSRSNSVGLDDRLEIGQEEDYTTEQSLVSSYIGDDGSTLIQRTQLKSFLKECSGLNCDKVVEVLKNNLSSLTDSNQIMKCLLMLEFLMTSDLVTLQGLTLVCRDGLVHVYNTQTGPPQSKARKLIRILEKLTRHDTILPINNQTDILVEA